MADIKPVGLGYEADGGKDGWHLAVDRITESRGEMHGELTVIRSPEGHLMRQRINLTSSTARTSAARLLTGRSNHVEWGEVLERFCVQVVDAQRAPARVAPVGTRSRREVMPYHLWPILPNRQSAIVFGSEGSYKSTIAAGIAYAVSTGITPYIGWEVRQPKGRVLVLDWEADEDDWNDMLASITDGVGRGVPPDVLYRACTTPVTDLVHEVSALIAEQGVGMVIIDSVGLATPRRYEGSDANESALRMFSVLRLWGISTLLIDHIPKTGDRSRPYGSMYKAAVARGTWSVTTHDLDQAFVTLALEKPNKQSRGMVQTMRIHGHDEGAIRFDTADAPEVEETRLQVDLIVDAIRDAGHALSEKEIEQASGVAGPRRVMSKPRHRDLFERVPGGWSLKEDLSPVTNIGDNG